MDTALELIFMTFETTNVSGPEGIEPPREFTQFILTRFQSVIISYLTHNKNRENLRGTDFCNLLSSAKT